MPRRLLNYLAALAAFMAVTLITRNVEYVIDQRDWDKALDAVVGAMPDFIGIAIRWLDLGGFLGGALAAFAVWACFEIGYAVQRKRRAVIPNAYIGRVQVRIRLVEASAIGFYFIGLNTAAAPLVVRGVQGWVDYRDHTRGPASSFVRLSDPQLAPGRPADFAPGAEFTVIVVHTLPQADADALQGLLVRDGAEVAFAFQNLRIEVTWGAKGGPERLPIWDEITCEVESPVLLGLPMPTDRRPGQRWPPRLV